jgi:hypothetical protein
MLNTKPPVPTYSFIEDPIDDLTHIVITSGLAAGIVFRFGRVRFIEGRKLRIKYDYKIVRNTEGLTEKKIVPIMDVILNDILMKESQEING